MFHLSFLLKLVKTGIIREECLGCSCAVSPDKETGRAGGSFSRRPSGPLAASAPSPPSPPLLLLSLANPPLAGSRPTPVKQTSFVSPDTSPPRAGNVSDPVGVAKSLSAAVQPAKAALAVIRPCCTPNDLT